MKICGIVLILVGLLQSARFAEAAGMSTKPTSFAELYKTVKPAVALIVSAQPVGGASSGSGFIFRSSPSHSEIITANHVIEGATNVDVILDSNIKERYPATILTRDHVKDVAVLRISVGNRKALSLLNPSSVQEGMNVAVIGYPRDTFEARDVEGDALRPTVHTGIVSAIRLNGEVIEFDAVTDHGNSGGPVIDTTSGKVIAIVHGYLLDPAYASRGLEQPLPGSFYGPSVATINSVISQAQQVPQSAGAVAAPAGNTTPNPNGNSASYRVGYVNISYSDEMSQIIDPAVDGKLAAFFQSDNSFYVVPVSVPDAPTSQQLLGFCQDNRLNAMMVPVVRYSLTGGPRYNVYGTIVGYSGYASVGVDLYVTDCAGDPFYVGSKQKSENRYFAHRTPDRELMDMANDLADQLENDFSSFRSAHQGEWNTLLKYGLPIDPTDGRYHGLFYPIKKNGLWQVYGVFPGGPADKAGLKPLDIIVAINDAPVSALGSDEIISMINKPSYTLTVQRPGGNVTITIQAEQYQQLISTLAH